MRLFYRKYGSGPPLIILHGLFGSSDNWVSIAKSISDKFTIILPDMRNHGQSPHNHVHDYNSMKEDLYELVNEMKLGKFFLAGHSMGGKTAVNFAFSWPEMLYGLLIADISPLAQTRSNTEDIDQHRQILNFMLSTDISGLRSRSEIESLLSRQIKSEKTRDLILKNLKREQDNSFSWKINASAILKNLDKIMEGIEPGDDGCSQITGFPVFFLKGENSAYLPESDFIYIQKVFPGAELIMIPGAGHWIHADNPEMVRKCFLRLLDS
jgi:pimeloyl-ACP methyl ester carboxylesterase